MGRSDQGMKPSGAGRHRWLRWAGLALALTAAFAFPAIRRGVQGHEVEAWSPSRTELVQTIVATGRVSALARVEIGSLVAGSVTEVAVREGDAVSQGGVLARLKDDEASAAVAQARSGVAQAEAGVAQAVAGAAAGARPAARSRPMIRIGRSTCRKKVL